MAINIEEGVEPMVPKLTQAGSPHMAAHDVAFVQQTQSLWWRCSGTRRSWIFPDPDTAPYCSTATLSTYTDFVVGNASVNADLALPWHYQEGSTGLVIKVVLCMTDPSLRASIRATLSGLDSAVTDKDSPGAIIDNGTMAPPGLWSRRTDTWMMAKATIRLTGILQGNMDSTNRGSIKLSAAFDFRTAPDNLSITHLLKIYSVQAYDVFPSPTPEGMA